jgi:murein DD-endopeptidase MepM/ murein hydrolase activator NlpD
VLRRWLIWFLLAGALLAGATAGAVSSAAPSGATAGAFGVKVSVPPDTYVGSSEADAPPNVTPPSESFSYPADGSIVKIDSIVASVATTTGTVATAAATAAVGGIQLFGGEITIDHLIASATAQASAGAANGNTLQTTVTGAIYQGQPLAIAANGRIPLGDWGYLQTLVQTVGAGDPGTKGYHESLEVLDLHVTAAHGGLPAGSEIIIGGADAFAEASTETETVTIPAGGPQPGSSNPGKPTKTKTTTTTTTTSQTPGGVRSVPPDLKLTLTRKGYVFPVYGQAWFSDSFGTPRADTIWHHGIDIFAPMGTPILAVADGTVFSVGWNDLGGNRLWLRDLAGNEFYYAHLSAYSPLAVNGNHVKAGDVLGFVGHTGDAITTPPHLHFETHPAALVPLGYDASAVDGYEWLVGLQHLKDVAFPAGTSAWAKQLAAHASTQQAGAVLMQATDISALPRLNPGALKSLLQATSSGTAPLLNRG